MVRDVGKYPSSSIDPIGLAHELVHSMQAGSSGYGEDFIEDEVEATILSHVYQGKSYKKALIRQRRKLSENLGISPIVFDEVWARVEKDLVERGFPFPRGFREERIRRYG